jgi:hypothetical protein
MKHLKTYLGGIASSSVSEEFRRIGILKPGRSGFQE